MMATSRGDESSAGFLQWLYGSSPETGDVALGDSGLKCHSLVLQWRQLTELPILAPTLRPEVVKAILKWAYANSFHGVSMEATCEVYVFARDLRHTELLKASLGSLEMMIAQEPSRASSVLKFSDLRNLPELAELCVRYLGLDGASLAANLSDILKDCTPRRAADILMRRFGDSSSVRIWPALREANRLIHNDGFFIDVVKTLEHYSQGEPVSVLNLACEHCDKALVSRLISAGYVMDMKSLGDEPLKEVIGSRGETRCACLLVFFESGIKCSETSGSVFVVDDDYPLHLAAANNAFDCVRVLLDRGGAVIHARARSSGRTALHEACSSGADEALRVLLDYSTEQTAMLRDETFGSTALHLAAQYGRLGCLEMVLERYQSLVNIGDQGGRTPLHRACGFAVDVFSSQTDALLLTAMTRPDAIIAMLLHHGADPACLTASLTTPLHWLCGGGGPSCVFQSPGILHKETFDASDAHARCVTELLKSAEGKKTLHMKTLDHSTALHIAVRFGFPSVAHVLVMNGADVNVLDSSKVSPLMLAMQAWPLELVARALIIPLPVKAHEPFQNTERCERCSGQFTLFYRPHHCRNCNACVCGSCSRRSLQQAKFRALGSDKPHRVCDWCYDGLLIAHHEETAAPPVLKIRPAKLFTVDG